MVDLGKGKEKRYGCGCRDDYRSKNEFTANVDSNTYDGTLELVIREHEVCEIHEVKFKLDIKTVRELNKLVTNHLHNHNVLVLEKRQEVEEVKSLLKDKEDELNALTSK